MARHTLPPVSYRPRSTPPASDWGRFLVRMRQERDWSAVQAHEHLHEGLGLKPKSKASYTALEDGKPPSATQERFLRAYFEGGPGERDRDPSKAEAVSSDGAASADLVEAIRDQ